MILKKSKTYLPSSNLPKAVFLGYPFGMNLPGRLFNAGEYRYGFNGHEKIDELEGAGNAYDFGARMYSPRLGRMFSPDPREKEYPWQTTYAYYANSPIWQLDSLGEGGPGKPVPIKRNGQFVNPGGKTYQPYTQTNTPTNDTGYSAGAHIASGVEWLGDAIYELVEPGLSDLVDLVSKPLSTLMDATDQVEVYKNSNFRKMNNKSLEREVRTDKQREQDKSDNKPAKDMINAAKEFFGIESDGNAKTNNNKFKR